MLSRRLSPGLVTSVTSRNGAPFGYRTTLFFLALPDADAAIARVAERVRQGGHDIPEVTIRRRFKAGWRNFQAVYRDAVDDWVLYDNAGVAPILLEWGNRG